MTRELPKRVTTVLRTSVVAVLVAALVAACGAAVGSPSAAPGVADRPVRLLVFGAASLRRPLEAIRSAYAATHPDVTIDLSTDSSAALATQIAQGAPADVFLAADAASPQRLIDAGLADGPATTFAGNSLVVVTPTDRTALATPADLARPGVRIIAAGDAVPITGYAAELVTNLARQPGYPAGFEVAYASNVVSREDNVQAVVTKLALGEGDAGIVYRTDALGAPSLRVVDVPEAAAVLAEYDGVVLAHSAHQDAARAFLLWLTEGDAQRLLADAGFVPPGP